MKRTFILTLGLLLTVSAFSQDIAGSWYGVLTVGTKLPLVIKISEKDGGYSATLDSPAQGAKGIPINTVSFENGKLTFSVAIAGIEYEGILQNDSITGTFKQNGMSFPLSLSRTPTTEESLAPPARSQDPKPPFPYRSEDVKFENKSAGITLAGTLTLPQEGKNFPVAVLVTGSGPQNRNEELLGHKPFLILSDYLTRNGIAVLRYDDRGVAESGGKYDTATLDDFASDAFAAVNYLKTRKEINPKKIGVIGHSYGGTIAFMLAGGKNSDLAYIVSMAGPAIPGDSLIRLQSDLIFSKAGATDAQRAESEKGLTEIDSIIKNYSDEAILKNMDKILDDLLPDSVRGDERYRANTRQVIRQMMGSETKSIMNSNPAEALMKTKCPVLALNGENDLQVPADINLDRIKALVKGKVTAKKYPNLNHLFQHCATGLPTEYGNIEETMSPEVLNDIAAWIKQVTR